MSNVSADQRRKALLASLVGTSSEWFDYLLYGFAAALLFGKLYFPKSDAAVGLMLSYLTFALPFFIRPFGGIFFAHLGDRIGRRRTLIITLSLLGGATFLIGLLPTYERWGVWAPCCLIALRIVQGFGIGGEWGGAVLVATENSSRRSLGFSGSVPQMGVPIGMLLGTSALAIVGKVTGEAQFFAWGWRLPFLASVLLTAVGLSIRLSMHETPVFTEARRTGQLSRVPLLDVLRSQWRDVILAIGLKVAETAPFYIMGTFVLTYVTVSLKMPRADVLNAITWATVACIVTIPVAGRIANRVSRKRLYIGGTVAMALFAFPYFWLLNTRSAFAVALASVLGMGILWAPITAVLGTLYSEIFPPEVRYTGATLGYQFGAAAAGGTAPLVATSLMYLYKGSYVPVALYFVFTCFISLLSILGIREKDLNINKSLLCEETVRAGATE